MSTNPTEEDKDVFEKDPPPSPVVNAIVCEDTCSNRKIVEDQEGHQSPIEGGLPVTAVARGCLLRGTHRHQSRIMTAKSCAGGEGGFSGRTAQLLLFGSNYIVNYDLAATSISSGRRQAQPAVFFFQSHILIPRTATRRSALEYVVSIASLFHRSV